MKGNVINLNTLHLNSVRLNGIGKVQSVSLKGGSTEDPVFPPVEPPVEPTPTYTLSASVTNGKVSAKRNGSAVNLPFTANEGDTIVVSVTPNDGYAFEGWADGNTDNPRSITMTADVALSAQCVEVVQPPVGNYIQFEDAEVERVLMSKGVSSDGVGITIEDAERVTNMSTWFQGNTSITSFDEARYFTNVKSLVTSAFNGCNALKSIRFSDNITEISGYCFYNCSALKSIEAKKVTLVKNYAFQSCVNLESVDFSLVETQAMAFNGCNALLSIDLSNLRIVGKNTFYNCTSLQYDELVLNVTSLGIDALYNVPIRSLKLPHLATLPTNNVGNYGDKKVLEEIEFSDSITNFPARSLYYYSKLQSVIIRATTPPSLANVDAFTQTNNCPIYVPDASLEAYKTATNWVSFADRIHPLSEIEGSPYIQFEDAEVERVLMANGVSSDGIGITKEDAANVTSIGTWFYNNTSIISFNEFGNFTSITALNDIAFRGASNLQFLTIPPNVASLGWRALGYCSNLNTLVILKSASVIPALSNTLEGMKVSNAIYVADSLVESYKTAAYWSAFADKIKPLSEYNG